MNKEFLHLPKMDQRKLLARNVPLYVQYVFASYINSNSGYDQLSWFLGSHVPLMTKKEKSKLKKISLRKLNQHINLFNFDADLNAYEELCDKLKLHDFHYEFVGMWIHLCIFQNGGELSEMALEEQDKIKSYCADMMKLWSYAVKNNQFVNSAADLADVKVIEEMMFLVEAMARFFAQVRNSCPAIQIFSNNPKIFQMKKGMKNCKFCCD